MKDQEDAGELANYTPAPIAMRANRCRMCGRYYAVERFGTILDLECECPFCAAELLNKARETTRQLEQQKALTEQAREQVSKALALRDHWNRLYDERTRTIDAQTQTHAAQLKAVFDALTAEPVGARIKVANRRAVLKALGYLGETDQLAADATRKAD